MSISPRLLSDYILCPIYALVIIFAIFIHYRNVKLLPRTKSTSIYLCAFLVNANILSVVNYALDWYIVKNNVCNFYLTGLYSILWNAVDMSLITCYLLHLLFWNQMYELYSGDTLLDYSVAPQAHVTIKKVFYRFLVLIGLILVSKVSFGIGVLYAGTNHCLDEVLHYSARDWQRGVYVFVWLSVALMPGWYLYYVYTHVYVHDHKHKTNAKNRSKVGIPAFVSQIFFIARSTIDLLTFFSRGFDEWFNSNITISNLFWELADVIPVIVLLLSFLALNKPKYSSMGRLPLLK